MDIAYPYKKHFFGPAFVITKIIEAFLSEQYCGSMNNSFLMKNEIRGYLKKCIDFCNIFFFLDVVLH